jgi:hypothetical protein
MRAILDQSAPHAQWYERAICVHEALNVGKVNAKFPELYPAALARLI